MPVEPTTTGVTRTADGRAIRGPALGLDALPRPAHGTPWRICFVCTGNICRSPMAEVAARSMAAATTLADGTALGDHVIFTSGGTGPWHEGEPMDPRTGAALRRAGYPDHPHVAHQVSARRLGAVHLIVALDRSHQRTLRGLGAPADRVVLLRAFDPASGAADDVPDPYYGAEKEFDDCLALIAQGCRGLVAVLGARWDEVLSP